MYELSQGYWVVDRMFPKFAKCDFYQHSMIGQIDVSSHLQWMYIEKINAFFLSQKIDFMCQLSFNYIYEKLYLVSMRTMSTTSIYHVQ